MTEKKLDAYYVAPIKNLLNYWLDYGMTVLSVIRIEDEKYSVVVENGINVPHDKAEESMRRAIRRAYLANGYEIVAWEIIPHRESEKKQES